MTISQAKMLCAITRMYLRYFPLGFGKLLLWNQIVRPYLLWRDIPLTAVAAFGARFEGSLLDVIHSYLYFFGVWEPGITRIYRQHLRPGDICIDIGANVGAHALLAAHLVGPNGRVHAIEASPTIHKRLVQNLTMNGYRNVQTYNSAVTDKPGSVTVYLHDSRNLGGTTIVRSETERQRVTTEEAEVDGYPLADIVPIQEIRNARLIKIDVEGAEWMVMIGMRDLLPSLRDDCLILMEVGIAALADHGATLDDLFNLFGSHGWQPVGLINSYRPEFYFHPPGRILEAEINRNIPMVDLAFAKPTVREALLKADHASKIGRG
jgi:FkbM family methyltransferase